MKKNIILTSVAVLSLISASLLLNKNTTAVSENSTEQGIDGYAELMKFYRNDPKTGKLNPKDIENAEAQIKQMDSRGRRLAKDLTWEFLGPDNVGGRTRAFIIDKDDPKLMVVGNVSGGIFRSTTAGSNWVPVLDNMSDLNITCLTQTDDGTMLAATGEAFFTNLNGAKSGSPAFVGGNMYTSSDKGLTWKRVVRKPVSSYFNTMEYNATNKKVYAGGSGGCFSSDDNGKTWTRIKTGNAIEVKIAPNGHVWLNQGGNIYLSTNGKDFEIQKFGISGANRVSIACSPQDANYVYFMAAKSSNNALEGVYRTTDGGSTYENIVEGGSPYSDPLSQAGTSNGQGKYDNVINVNPLDKEYIYMGGVQLGIWEPKEGFKIISTTVQRPGRTNYVHADKHLMKWDMSTTPPTMIIATDGGLFFSQDQITWTERNRNYGTFQCYAISGNKLGHVLAGSQDNGCQLINGNGNTQDNNPSKSAIEIQGGDGFSTELSNINTKTMFTTSQFGRLRRSGNGGKTTSTIWDERISGTSAKTMQNDSKFFSQIYLWENEKEEKSRLFHHRKSDKPGLWMAIDASTQDQPVWFRVSDVGGDVTEMESTPSGSSLFVSVNRKVVRIDSLNTANYDEDLYETSAIPAELVTKDIYSGSRVVTSVNIDPNDENHLIITLGNYGTGQHVLESFNALDVSPTFTNITGNLPGIPFYDAVISYDNSKYIVVGSDRGTFATENGGVTWEHQINGFASVPVFELKQYKFYNGAQGVIYAGTHGRGMWKTKTLVVSDPNVKTVKNTSLSIYPNPVIDFAVSKFNTTKAEKISINIYSLNGQLVSTKVEQAQLGANSISNSTHKLKEGMYIMVVEGKTFKTSAKFMKVN